MSTHGSRMFLLYWRAEIFFLSTDGIPPPLNKDNACLPWGVCCPRQNLVGNTLSWKSQYFITRQIDCHTHTSWEDVRNSNHGYRPLIGGGGPLCITKNQRTAGWGISPKGSKSYIFRRKIPAEIEVAMPHKLFTLLTQLARWHICLHIFLYG